MFGTQIRGVIFVALAMAKTIAMAKDMAMAKAMEMIMAVAMVVAMAVAMMAMAMRPDPSGQV